MDDDDDLFDGEMSIDTDGQRSKVQEDGGGAS